MKLHQITARDIPDAWFQAIELCYKKGQDYLVREGSYEGCQVRRQLPFVTINIVHPQTRPLLPEVPPGLGIPNPVPGGIEWIENDYLPYIMTDSRQPGEDYTYGERMFSSIHGLNMFDSAAYAPPIEECIAKLNRTLNTNQAILSIAKPGDIHLKDPPCLRSLSFHAAPGTRKLDMYIHFRSWDLWGGTPANLAALTYLQDYICQETNTECGEFLCFSEGLHLYSMYWELAKIRLGEV